MSKSNKQVSARDLITKAADVMMSAQQYLRGNTSKSMKIMLRTEEARCRAWLSKQVAPPKPAGITITEEEADLLTEALEDSMPSEDSALTNLFMKLGGCVLE